MAVKHQGLAWRVELWTNLAMPWSRDMSVQDLAGGGWTNVREKHYHSEHSPGLVYSGGCRYNKSQWNIVLSCGLVFKSYITWVQHFVPRHWSSSGWKWEATVIAAVPTVILLSRQQNQRDKLHPSANVWTDVKVGQRGNFNIISTASMPFSVKGDVHQGQPWCDPACMDSSRGTANPFICCHSSYLPHGDGWEELAPLRPAQTPWGRQGSPSQTLWVYTNTKTGERRKEVARSREGCRRQATSKTQTNLKQEMT